MSSVYRILYCQKGYTHTTKRIHADRTEMLTKGMGTLVPQVSRIYSQSVRFVYFGKGQTLGLIISDCGLLITANRDNHWILKKLSIYPSFNGVVLPGT